MGMFTSDPRPKVVCGKGRTKQSFKEQCDVNKIVEKFARTGLIAHLAQGVPRFMDVSELPDYRTALTQVKKAQLYFEDLPANVREVFDNDVARFVDWMSTKSLDELEAMSMAEVDKISVAKDPDVKPVSKEAEVV